MGVSAGAPQPGPRPPQAATTGGGEGPVGSVVGSTDGSVVESTVGLEVRSTAGSTVGLEVGYFVGLLVEL